MAQSGDPCSERQPHSDAAALRRGVNVDREALALALWPLNWLFALGGPSLGRTVLRCGLLLLLPVIVLVGLSALDGTLVMPGDQVGLFEHAGFLTFFLIHICIVLLLPRTIGKCLEALAHVEETVDWAEVAAQDAGAKVHEVLEATERLFRRSARGRALSGIATALGLIAVTYNAINTLFPKDVYHHDVWDSWGHQLGYWGARAYLTLCWGVILPAVLLGMLWFCYSIYQVYSRLGRVGPVGVVAVRPLSPDRAGGMRKIRSAMMGVVLNVFPLGLFTVSLVYVHGLTLSNIVGTAGWLVILCCVFFVPLSSVHVGMMKRKLLILGEIESRFNQLDDTFRSGLRGSKGANDEGIPGEALKGMEALHQAFNRAARMPVWPFDLQSLSRFFSVIVFQIFLTALGAVLPKLL